MKSRLVLIIGWGENFSLNNSIGMSHEIQCFIYTSVVIFLFVSPFHFLHFLFYIKIHLIVFGMKIAGRLDVSIGTINNRRFNAYTHAVTRYVTIDNIQCNSSNSFLQKFRKPSGGCMYRKKLFKMFYNIFKNRRNR